MDSSLVEGLVRLDFLTQMVEIRIASISQPWPIALEILQGSAIFHSVPTILVKLAMKTLIALRMISSHFVWPLKIRLIFYFVKDLVHKFPKNCVNCLCRGLPSKLWKVPSCLIIVIPI